MVAPPAPFLMGLLIVVRDFERRLQSIRRRAGAVAVRNEFKKQSDASSDQQHRPVIVEAPRRECANSPHQQICIE
jgi:hypothetical protein